MNEYKYSYPNDQIDKMVSIIQNYDIDINVNLTHEYFTLKTERYQSIISFKDFKVGFDIFLQIAQPQENILKFGSINFKMKDLREGILNPTCSCGGNIETDYDGEYSEDYYFTCECGAKATLDGYMLDSLLED